MAILCVNDIDGERIGRDSSEFFHFFFIRDVVLEFKASATFSFPAFFQLSVLMIHLDSGERELFDIDHLCLPYLAKIKLRIKTESDDADVAKECRMNRIKRKP